MSLNHLKYVDFLKDKRFIRWQLMPDEELDNYWRKFLEENPNNYESVRKAIMFLKEQGLNESTLSEHEIKDLYQSIEQTVQQNRKRKSRSLLLYATVASIAIALVLVGITRFLSPTDFFITEDQELIVGEPLNAHDILLITNNQVISFKNDVEITVDKTGTAKISQKDDEISEVDFKQDKFTSLMVPYGKRSTLTLSDGTKVWLNSGTVLEFPAQFSGNKREIHLVSGEMYIEVITDTDRPFYVKSSDFNVRVYGTKFNITNYIGAQKSVVLVEGSVGLQSSKSVEFVLVPNERATYTTNGSFDTEIVDIKQLISWKEGFLIFDRNTHERSIGTD